MAGDGIITRLMDSGEQISHALGLDPLHNVVDSVLISSELGWATVLPEKAAAFLRDNAARNQALVDLRKGDTNRAHIMETLDKQTSHGGESIPAAKPAPPTQRDTIIDEQRFLKEAGYGDILTRHGEKDHGLDGIRGRDLVAAENQYRKDHHLSVDIAISGGDSYHGAPKAMTTPSVANAEKLRKA